MRKLTVLSREYCHLCEEFIRQLKQFQGRYDFEIDVIDIDKHPELEARFSEKVPVLLDGHLEVCHHFLVPEAVDARLGGVR